MAKLSERDVCSEFITPALVSAGWDLQTQIREEVSFTKGRIIVRGKLHSRGKGKRADYVLYWNEGIRSDYCNKVARKLLSTLSAFVQ